MTQSLEEKLHRAGSAMQLLRNAPSNRFRFDYPDQYTNWQDEQAGWTTTAPLFDQSHHMTDVYFTGPDVDVLLVETGTNSFANWGAGQGQALRRVHGGRQAGRYGRAVRPLRESREPRRADGCG